MSVREEDAVVSEAGMRLRKGPILPSESVGDKGSARDSGCVPHSVTVGSVRGL